ncbi:hypothetical protein [Occallatibacter riparius]|uniref:Uncharacterized protein n=1 Tax=Occallatibacter riparius TaxID=1002689 RepID=A0A9J7BKA5_9BACT|nr:hypothetical protein [Occallatibacter riparius]UWZ83095.1 hypothetical protein MOP44_21300 [Occallatibacter riparius]
MTHAARFYLGSIAFALIIVLPVFVYLKRRRQSEGRIVLWILGIWVIWNLVNAPIHEVSHLLGGWSAGQHVNDYRLIPHFWEGDFVHAYISWEAGTPSQYKVSTLAPYAIDGLVILLGFALCWRQNRMPPFTGTLILFLFFLRPFYDVATNYAADAILGGTGDVAFLLYAYPRPAVHLCAWMLMFLAAAGAFREIWTEPRNHEISISASATER